MNDYERNAYILKQFMKLFNRDKINIYSFLRSFWKTMFVHIIWQNKDA